MYSKNNEHTRNHCNPASSGVILLKKAWIQRYFRLNPWKSTAWTRYTDLSSSSLSFYMISLCCIIFAVHGHASKEYTTDVAWKPCWKDHESAITTTRCKAQDLQRSAKKKTSSALKESFKKNGNGLTGPVTPRNCVFKGSLPMADNQRSTFSGLQSWTGFCNRFFYVSLISYIPCLSCFLSWRQLVDLLLLFEIKILYSPLRVNSHSDMRDNLRNW